MRSKLSKEGRKQEKKGQPASLYADRCRGQVESGRGKTATTRRRRRCRHENECTVRRGFVHTPPSTPFVVWRRIKATWKAPRGANSRGRFIHLHTDSASPDLPLSLHTCVSSLSLRHPILFFLPGRSFHSFSDDLDHSFYPNLTSFLRFPEPVLEPSPQLIDSTRVLRFP